MAIAVGLVSSFFINSAVSVGLNLLGSWLSPRKDNSIPENVPTASTNVPLYLCWGSTFCPGIIFYAVPPAKAGHGDDRSSYGVLGFSNPDYTAELEAIRSNGIIVSSKTPLFSLNAPGNVIPGTSKYTNQYGMSTYNNYTFKTQLGSNTFNSHFGALNQAGLQYSGLTWLKIEGAERKLFGGFNSRTVIYAKNRIDTTKNTGFDIRDNNKVVVVANCGRQGFFTIQWDDIRFEYPSGFFGVQIYLYFEGRGRRSFSLLGLGGDVEFVIRQDVFDCNFTLFTVLGNVVPGGARLTKGKYSVNSVYAGANQHNTNQGMVTSAIIGADQGEVVQVNLTQPGQTPLYSVNGKIYDNNNTLVYSGNGSSRLYGWGGKMFYANDFRDVAVQEKTSSSSDIYGLVSIGTTKLSTILKDLLLTKNVPLSRISFVNFTDKDVRGFTCTDDNIKQLILNLCTAYGKIVDEGFGNNYVFQDYPLGDNPKVISLEQHLSEPIIEYSDEANQPKEIEFTFRNWQEEYSEKSITVGYGSEFPNRSSQKIDIVLTTNEAKLLAWNQYFLLGHTNMAVRLHLSSIEGIQSGSVLNLVNPGTAHLKLLVGNVEIGADCTFMVNCVNFVPLNILNSTAGYLPYMVSSTGVSPASTTVDTSFRQIYFTEPRELDATYTKAGALFYTTDTANYSSLTTDGNLNPQNTISPSVFGFKGFLNAVNSNFATSDIDYLNYLGYGVVSLLIIRDNGNSNSLPANGTIRIGQTWVSYTGVTTTGNANVLTGVRVGLFGSSRYIQIGEPVVDIPVANKIKGVQTTLNSLSLPKVSQGVSTTFSYFQAPSQADATGTPIAEVSPFATYGAPASGLVVGDLLSQYDGSGILKIWFTNPGAIENPDFFLFPPASSNRIQWKSFWIKDSTGNAVYLGSFDPATTDQILKQVTIPSGRYEIFQRLENGLVNPAGSFRHLGVAK